LGVLLFHANGKIYYVENFRGIIFYTDEQELAKKIKDATSFTELNSALRQSNKISRIDASSVIATGIGVAITARVLYGIASIKALTGLVEMRLAEGVPF